LNKSKGAKVNSPNLSARYINAIIGAVSSPPTRAPVDSFGFIIFSSSSGTQERFSPERLQLPGSCSVFLGKISPKAQQSNLLHELILIVIR
jgi:hypothetical protein